jgi:hypothetical protein
VTRRGCDVLTRTLAAAIDASLRYGEAPLGHEGAAFRMATPTSVEALEPGDHACLTFSDPDERLDIVAAFVRDGLSRANKVMCFTESIPPDQLTTELTDRGVSAANAGPEGQLTIYGSEDSWLSDGPLTAAKMIELLACHLDQADREGYSGLRITADMCWVTRPVAAVDQLPVFEAGVGRLFADNRLTAICQYDREVFDAVTLALAAEVHPRAVAAAVYYEDPVLRVCRQHSPPGVRLAGEIDFTHIEELRLALSEALRLDHDFQVNLAKLRFMDVECATTLVHTALSLPPGRVMTVVCGGVVCRMLDLIGVREVPALRVSRVYGER